MKISTQEHTQTYNFVCGQTFIKFRVWWSIRRNVCCCLDTYMKHVETQIVYGMVMVMLGMSRIDFYRTLNLMRKLSKKYKQVISHAYVESGGLTNFFGLIPGNFMRNFSYETCLDLSFLMRKLKDLFFVLLKLIYKFQKLIACPYRACNSSYGFRYTKNDVHIVAVYIKPKSHIHKLLITLRNQLSYLLNLLTLKPIIC